MNKMDSDDIEALFVDFGKKLERDSDSREEVKKITKDIDFLCRQMSSILQQIHTNVDKCMKYFLNFFYFQIVHDITSKANELLPKFKEQFTLLSKTIISASETAVSPYKF